MCLNSTALEIMAKSWHPQFSHTTALKIGCVKPQVLWLQKCVLPQNLGAYRIRLTLKFEVTGPTVSIVLQITPDRWLNYVKVWGCQCDAYGVKVLFNHGIRRFLPRTLTEVAYAWTFGSRSHDAGSHHLRYQ